MRILIIEDDRKLCDSLKFQLEKEGILTDLCYDGEDGLDYIRQRTHDLVLLDRMLPSMDGLTVLEKIRARVFPLLSSLSPHWENSPIRSQDSTRGQMIIW